MLRARPPTNLMEYIIPNEKYRFYPAPFMHYVYILRNTIRNQIYVGSTNDLRKRFSEHNDGKQISTKRYRPWDLVYYEAFCEEKLARLREQKLKYNGNAMKELKLRIGLSKNGAGFTLIEILLAMSIVLLIASGSFIGFKSFNQQQALSSTWDTLRNNFNEARSNAASQVIRTSVCNSPGQTLVGHQLNFYTNSYDLVEVCQNAGGAEPAPLPLIKTIPLPPGITFNPVPNPAFIRFVVLTGGISGVSNRTVTITNTQGNTRSITVNTVGVIQ